MSGHTRRRQFYRCPKAHGTTYGHPGGCGCRCRQYRWAVRHTGPPGRSSGTGAPAKCSGRASARYRGTRATHHWQTTPTDIWHIALRCELPPQNETITRWTILVFSRDLWCMIQKHGSTSAESMGEGAPESSKCVPPQSFPETSSNFFAMGCVHTGRIQRME